MTKINKEDILNTLIRFLYREIYLIRAEIETAIPKEKARLRRELRGSALALADLLQMLPQESEVDDWLQIIAEKAPKKFAKHVCSLIKFTGKVIKDEEVSKRRNLKDS